MSVTNENWIDICSDEDGTCVLVCNLGKLVKPEDEDADIAAMLVYTDAALKISQNNINVPIFNLTISLKDLNINNIQIRTIIKTISVIQKERPDTVNKIKITNIEKKYIFIWDAVKHFIDKDTLEKITLETTDGSIINDVKNIEEKNLSN